MSCGTKINIRQKDYIAQKVGGALSSFVLKIFFASLLLICATLRAQGDPVCTLEMKFEGAIGPGILDYFERGLKKASEDKCDSVLLLINTPGGNLQTTRIIVEKILNSRIPILCLVAPPGGHAGSAGAIILQACHVAGAMTATNLGAATPISGTGEQISDDLRKKLLNDTISWLEGITKLRGRSLEFSKKIVSEAKALDAKQAFKEGAIDVVPETVEEFLKFSKDRIVKVANGVEAKVVVGDVILFKSDTRFKLLQLFSDPQLAYLLFMGSLALLYFEITHPGTIAPGVIGAIGLVLSLVNFHALDVRWGGLALMALGILMLILEAFVPSFGALGVGGIISFILGGIFLFDGSATGLALPLSTILTTAIGFGAIMLGLATLAFRAQKRKPQTGSEELIGAQAEVVKLSSNKKSGNVRVNGELWKFECKQELEIKQIVTIDQVKGLTLSVRPVV